MAREYGTVQCSIWDDPDFCMLGAGAQRTYLMLTTQPDISACGTLALTLRRWAKTCSEKDLEKWLAELVAARFVLIDEDTEELLVRTFAKYDGGYKHAVRRKAVLSTARAIRSVELRDTCAAELAKLDHPSPTPEPPDRHPSGTQEALESTQEAPECGGSVVTEVSIDHTPESLNLEPGASGYAAPPSMYCSKHPNGTDKPCGPCKDARLRYAEYAKAKVEAQVEQRKRQQERRKNCTRCDENGMRLDKDTRQPVGRCNHMQVAS